MKLPLVHLAAVAVLSFVPACDGGSSTEPPPGVDCTDQDCGDNALRLEFSPALSTPGRWTLGVTGEGFELRCSITLPATSDVPCVPEAKTTGTGFRVVHSVDGLKGLTIDRLGQELHPPQLTVTMAYEGIPVGDVELEPAWAVSYPNGEACGPTCYKAPIYTLKTDVDDEDAGT